MSALPELGAASWVLLALAAALAGFAKTAIGGAASLSVVAFALVLPARESTGALLPLLICGDVLAVGIYRRHADWGMLLRLLPGVVPGLLVGAWFIGVADDQVVRRTIAAILLVLTGLSLARVVRADGRRPAKDHRALTTLAAGAAAGFATMTANAAGPVMTVYLVAAGLPVLGMLGTSTWFFFVVNLAKLPLSAGLGLVSTSSLALDLVLVPPLVVGAVAGAWLVRRIDQRHFERAALALALAAALLLAL